MSVQTLVSEKEYLETSYEPDCDFEDGVLIERNVGTGDHSWLQASIAALFFQKRRAWNLNAYTEQRSKIRAGKYLIPDVCIVEGPRRHDKVFLVPPLLVIEVLSPEDRYLRVNQRVRDYLNFGVPYVWVIDPETFESELHTKSGSQKLEEGVLRLPGTPIEVNLKALQAE